MRRLIAIALIALCSIALSISPLGIHSARAAVTRLPVVLLVQRSYFVSEGDGCRIDVQGQRQVLLKVNDVEGRRRGGAWFAKGEVITTTGPSGASQEYCAFVKTAEVKTRDTIELVLHDRYLTTLDLDDYVADTHVVLEVDNDGLVAEGMVTPAEVTAMGLEPLESVGASRQVTPSSETGVTRTPRTPDASRTSRTTEVSRTPRTGNSTETTTRNSREVSRGTTRTTSQPTAQPGIVTGDWELEGSSEFDILYVTIDSGWYGIGPDFVASFDALELAVEIGAPLIGEGRAPEGCRVFAYTGPLGIPLFVGTCANGDFLFYALSTDKELLDDAMGDFANGEPFVIPYGYYES